MAHCQRGSKQQQDRMRQEAWPLLCLERASRERNGLPRLAGLVGLGFSEALFGKPNSALSEGTRIQYESTATSAKTLKMYKRQDWLHLHGQQAAEASSSGSESDKTGALTDTTCSMPGVSIHPVSS